jgi:hypothetical protein
MRAICFGFDFKELLCGYNSGIGLGETNANYSLQMNVLRNNLLAENIPGAEFIYKY